MLISFNNLVIKYHKYLVKKWLVDVNNSAYQLLITNNKC